MAKVNLCEFDTATQLAALEILRLGEDETPVIPFTAEGEALDLHYVEESEIRGYVRCNGEGCILCRIGRKVDPRILLPVYSPTSDLVGVLMVSTARTPYALLPPLLQSVRSGRREILFVRRSGAKYTVSARPLAEGEEDGAATIKSFLDRIGAGELSLESVVTSISNAELADIPGIARHMALKGIAAA